MHFKTEKQVFIKRSLLSIFFLLVLLCYVSAAEDSIESNSNRTPVHTSQIGNYKPTVILTNNQGIQTTIFAVGETITASVISGDPVTSHTNGTRYYWMTSPTASTSLFYQRDDKPYNIDMIHSRGTFIAPNIPGSYYLVVEEVNTAPSESGSPIWNTETTIRQFTVVEPDPGITIEKTSSVPTYKKDGDIITYIYKVTNTGNVPLTGPISVTDNRTNGGSPFIIYTDPIFPVGATITATRSYIVTPVDEIAPFIINSAYATGTYNDIQVVSDTVNFTVDKLIQRRISISKTAYPLVYYNVGDIITYTYTVTNSGNVAIQAPIRVSDSHINGGTFFTIYNNTITNGESVTGIRTYRITQADIDAGSVTNTAYATGDHGNALMTSENDSATVIFRLSPKLTIEKIASTSTFDTVGQLINYTYKVTNTGNVPITAPITVTDNRINSGTPFIISNNNLAVGANVTGTSTYSITQSDKNSGRVTNRATASGTYNGTKITSLGDYASIYSQSHPGFIIQKSANPSNYDNAGDIITYTYTVTNNGNVELEAPIMVADNRINGNTPFVVSNNNLPEGASVTGSANYTITQTNVNIGAVTNTAYALSSFNGTRIQSTVTDATVNAIQNPKISLNKLAIQSTYNAEGDIIDYSYTVNNTGNVPLLAPIVIFDDHINNGDAFIISNNDLGVGQIVTGSAKYNITLDDIQSKSVTNRAFATAGYNNTRIQSNTDEATSVLNVVPSLSITKSASPTTYNAVGQIITYTYNVTNTGNVPINQPIQVSDNYFFDGNPFIISNYPLLSGSSVVGTQSHMITQEDIAAGSITNIAFASGIHNDTIVTSSPVSATITATAPPTYNLSIQDDSGIPQTSFGSGDNVHAVFTTTDTSLTQVTYVWKDSTGNIVKTDTVSINANAVSLHNPVTTGTWDIEVYPNTATIGTPLVDDTFNVAVPEFAFAVIPLLLVSVVYIFMRRKFKK